MRKFLTPIVLSTALLLGACQTNNQTIGTLGGGVIGGVLGSHIGSGSGRLVAVGAGAAIGALLGNNIGSRLDAADKQAAAVTTQHTLEHQPDHRPGHWRNPNTGNAGQITPTQTYIKDNRYCREFQHTVYIGGKAEKAYGTACRQPDGAWEIQ